MRRIPAFFWPLFLCGLLLGCDPASGPGAAPEPQAGQLPDPREVTRGVWLTNVDSEALFSEAGIREAVDRCVAYGFNTIFTVTWNRGYTLYPSPLMEAEFGRRIDPRLAGRDPLKELIDYAHSRGVAVFAWFEFGFSSSYEEPDGGFLLRQRPEWAAIDTSGRIVSKNGFQWMNAFDPAVQDFLQAMVLEVVDRYEVDGVQGDDRLPALPSLGGYDSLTQTRYYAETGRRPPRDIFDPEWVQWRSDLLSNFQCRLYRAVKDRKPEVMVSVSPSIYPWSKEQYLQDWPTWVQRQCVDMICPQIYRYDFAKYELELNKIWNEQLPTAYRDRMFPGILLKVGDYYADTSLLRQKIEANRERGIQGEVFFFYEGLKKYPEFFGGLYGEVVTW